MDTKVGREGFKLEKRESDTVLPVGMANKTDDKFNNLVLGGCLLITTKLCDPNANTEGLNLSIS